MLFLNQPEEDLFHNFRDQKELRNAKCIYIVWLTSFCIFHTNHGNTSVITKSLQKKLHKHVWFVSISKKKNDVPVKANSRLNDSQKEIKKKQEKSELTN